VEIKKLEFLLDEIESLIRKYDRLSKDLLTILDRIDTLEREVEALKRQILMLKMLG